MRGQRLFPMWTSRLREQNIIKKFEFSLDDYVNGDYIIGTLIGGVDNLEEKTHYVKRT